MKIAARRSEGISLRTTVRAIIRLMMAKPVALQYMWTGAPDGPGSKSKFRGSPAHEFLLSMES